MNNSINFFMGISRLQVMNCKKDIIMRTSPFNLKIFNT